MTAVRGLVQEIVRDARDREILIARRCTICERPWAGDVRSRLAVGSVVRDGVRRGRIRYRAAALESDAALQLCTGCAGAALIAPVFHVQLARRALAPVGSLAEAVNLLEQHRSFLTPAAQRRVQITRSYPGLRLAPAIVWPASKRSGDGVRECGPTGGVRSHRRESSGSPQPLGQVGKVGDDSGRRPPLPPLPRLFCS